MSLRRSSYSPALEWFVAALMSLAILFVIFMNGAQI